jgi:hypothetical protein
MSRANSQVEGRLRNTGMYYVSGKRALEITIYAKKHAVILVLDHKSYSSYLNALLPERLSVGCNLAFELRSDLGDVTRKLLQRFCGLPIQLRRESIRTCHHSQISHPPSIGWCSAAVRRDCEPNQSCIAFLCLHEIAQKSRPNRDAWADECACLASDVGIHRRRCAPLRYSVWVLNPA